MYTVLAKPGLKVLEATIRWTSQAIVKCLKLLLCLWLVVSIKIQRI